MPLNATARRALRQLFEQYPPTVSPGDPVFRSTRNEPLPVRSIQNTITGLVRRAGIKRSGVSAQPGQVGLGTVQVDVPSCEIEQVVAVAATGGSRDILGGKTVEEGQEPGREIGHRRSCLYCTHFRPPG